MEYLGDDHNKNAPSGRGRLGRHGEQSDDWIVA
jgi:hypothetical protein